jgi:hypothetical protein
MTVRHFSRVGLPIDADVWLHLQGVDGYRVVEETTIGRACCETAQYETRVRGRRMSWRDDTVIQARARHSRLVGMLEART